MNLPDFTVAVPRAVALDLDGTTLDSSSVLAARTAHAIRAIVASGIPVIIATARPMRVLPRLLGDEIVSMCSVVQMNGTVADGRPPLAGIVRRPMPAGQAELCWSLVTELEPAARMTVELDGFRFAVNHQGDVAALWNLNSATPEMIVSADEAFNAGPSKISINGLGLDLQPLLSALEQRLDDEIDLITADSGTFINVVHCAATKEGAIESLLRPAGITLQEVLAFGDDFPDTGLLSHCGWPVAVANAVPEIAALARYQTATNDEFGVALVLERLARALDASPT